MSDYKDFPPPYNAEYPGSTNPQMLHFGNLPPGFVPALPVLPRSAQSQYGLPPPSSSDFGGYGATTIFVENTPIIIGACPACRIGVLEDEFTCGGILCAILFFPLGIFCCLAMREKTCRNCGATFG